MAGEPITWKVGTDKSGTDKNFMLPQSYRRATCAGIGVSSTLICFVGLYNGTVSALKFFTAENGEGLADNPFGSEHIRQMTTFKSGIGAMFGGAFSLERAIRDFRRESGAERIIYDADEIPFDFEGGVPIKREDQALFKAADWLYHNRLITSASGRDPRLGVLTHYLQDLPPAKEFDAHRGELSVPLVAVLHAIVAAYGKTEHEWEIQEAAKRFNEANRLKEKAAADEAARKKEADAIAKFKAECDEVREQLAQLPSEQSHVYVSFPWNETRTYRIGDVADIAVALKRCGGKLAT